MLFCCLLTAKRRNVSILRSRVEELLTLTQISVTLPTEMLTGLLKNTLKDAGRSVGSKASGCELWTGVLVARHQDVKSGQECW